MLLTIDNQLDEAYYLKGRYYRAKWDIEEALENYDKTLKINPNYYAAYRAKRLGATSIKNDYVSGIDNYNKALNRIRGNERSSLLRDLGFAYKDIGFFEKAKDYFDEAFTLDSNKAANFATYPCCMLRRENLTKDLKLKESTRSLIQHISLQFN